MLPLVIQFPASSQDPEKGPEAQPFLALSISEGGGVPKGEARESQSPDLALCPCRSGARFYCNPYILLQILNQLEPRLGWTLW